MEGGTHNGTIMECDLNITSGLNSQWIYNAFGECVLNQRQYAAFIIGTLSIVCWLLAQLPQIVENCRTGTADKSLSFWFLLLWLFSDFANMLGALLTKQLATQIIVGIYFVLIDVASLTQFLYHYSRNRKLINFSIQRRRAKRRYGSITLAGVLVLLPSMMLLSSFTLPADQHRHSNTESLVGGAGEWSGRHLLEAEEPLILKDSQFLIGYSLGCFSAVVYFFALPPQIWKNFKRSSVQGLSLLMFIFVTLGDLTYLLGVILFRTDKVFIVRTLPWILGSSWSVFFDVIIVTQIMVYKYIEHFRSPVSNETDLTEGLSKTQSVKSG